MRIFLAGATGAIGTPLVPLLVDAGHEVTGMTRSQRQGGRGCAPPAPSRSIADGLDRDAVVAAVTAARPDVIVHQLTGLTDMTNLRNFDGAFALTNRLRTEGTDNLLAGAEAAGAQPLRRAVLRRLAVRAHRRAGQDRGRPARPRARAVDARDARRDPPRRGARRCRRAAWRSATAAFYGPGTGFAPGGEQLELVRKRQFPIVGDGGGVWSFIHIHDAAAATLAAIERGAPGVYNVVDDDPAPAREWLPVLAAAAGAKPPRHVPRWLGTDGRRRGASWPLMTEIRGASNAKAKRELGWRPAYPSWREGFADSLRSGAVVAAA